MLVRGVGIRDVTEIEKISISKVLSILTKSQKIFIPKQRPYNELKVDELWKYVGSKKKKSLVNLYMS